MSDAGDVTGRRLDLATRAAWLYYIDGATQDEKINYRLAASSDKQRGVVRNTDYGRINLTAASQAQILSWLNTDASMAYTYDNNDQAYKGNIGPLIGLMLWPQTDKAEDYLTPSGVTPRPRRGRRAQAPA